MAKRQLFHFVAGEQHMQAPATNHLDAFLAIKIRSRRQPMADEFRRLPIEIFDEAGELIGRKTWDAWSDDLLRDTYGDDFKDKLARATELL